MVGDRIDELVSFSLLFDLWKPLFASSPRNVADGDQLVDLRD